MPQVIRVRDVVRKGAYDLRPDEPVLRGPYELFQPVGPVQRRGSLVDYVQGGVLRSARAVPTTLGETHAGERVLVRLPQLPAGADAKALPEQGMTQARSGPEGEWWVCEVEAVDGLAAG